MHLRWQIKQVNTVDGEHHVNRCNTFGGCSSGALFIAFNSLVAWIAKRKKGIRYLGNYVDDSWGCGLEGDYAFYSLYQKAFPRDQVILLSLWDELGIPHHEPKQIHGPEIPIIGINVDVNELTFTLTAGAKDKLIEELQWWCKPGRKEKLCQWYQAGGWVNWAFNVYPRLRPALNHFYPKLKGRRDSTSLLWVNNLLHDDFNWAVGILQQSTGVHLLKSICWDLTDATHMIYCDVCPDGMGFWYLDLCIGFYSPTPSYKQPDLIFYFEALCVLSALFDAHQHAATGGRGCFLIYTDNSNTVDIFNTLRTLPPYNHLLRAAIDILNSGDHDLRVLHVPGIENAVADALSQAEFSRALILSLNLKVATFEPWSWSPDANGSLQFQPP